LQDIAVTAAQGVRRAGSEARDALAEIEAVGAVVFIRAAGQGQFAAALFGERAAARPVQGTAQRQVRAAQIENAVGLHVERVGIRRAAAACHEGGAAREGQRARPQNVRRGDRDGASADAYAAGERVRRAEMQRA